MNPWKADVVYRTNLQTAYNAGHYKAMTDPTTRKLRPYWQYITAGDGDVRPSHAAMQGKVFRCDDPIWDIWYPQWLPLPLQCRVPNRGAGKALGLLVESVMPHEIDPETGEAVFYWPDKGFSGNPAKWSEAGYEKYPS